jgi:hypothetical protein
MKTSKIIGRFMAAIAVCILTLSLSACGQDKDKINGLWLVCPSFPQDAKEQSFTNDKDTGAVTYIRELDGKLTFEISRRPIKTSEPQNFDGVDAYIEKRVNSEKIDQEAKESNIYDISVNTNPDELVELYKQPCAAAEYMTGANESRRKNLSLFLFTSLYCFEVNVSVADDAAGDYGERVMDWLKGMNFIENGGKNAAGK